MMIDHPVNRGEYKSLYADHRLLACVQNLCITLENYQLIHVNAFTQRRRSLD